MATARMKRIEDLIAISTSPEIAIIERRSIARQKALDAATVSLASKAFAIPEILEAILLQLPMQQIYTVQRVCRAFKLLTETSVPLRRKIFLEYKTARPIAIVECSILETRLRLIGGMLTRFHFWEARYNEQINTIEIEADSTGRAPLEPRETANSEHVKSWMTMNIATFDVPIKVQFVWRRYNGVSSTRLVRVYCLGGNERKVHNVFQLANTVRLELNAIASAAE